MRGRRRAGGDARAGRRRNAPSTAGRRRDRAPGRARAAGSRRRPVPAGRRGADAAGAGAACRAPRAARPAPARAPGAGPGGGSGMTPVERTTRCAGSAAAAGSRSTWAAGASSTSGRWLGGGRRVVAEAATGSTAGAARLGRRLGRRPRGPHGPLGLLGRRLARALRPSARDGAPRRRRGGGRGQRGVVDARRVALHADLEALGEIEHHLVLDAELSRQLVDPDLLRGQAFCLLPCVAVRVAPDPLRGVRPSRALDLGLQCRT